MLTTIPVMDDATVNNQIIFLDLIEFVFLVRGGSLRQVMSEIHSVVSDSL